MKDDLNKNESAMEEIADYYLKLEKNNTDMPSDTEEALPATDTNRNVTRETEKNIVFAENSTSEQSDSKKDFDKKNIIFFASVFAGAFAILLIVFICGVTSEKAEEDINFELAHMINDSKEYTQYENDIEKAKADIDALTKEIDIKQAELNTLTDFESNTGTIKSRINVLNEEIEELKSSLSQREKTISDLNNSIAQKRNASFTLTPGLYTVGKNVHTGSFEVSGNGILTVSDVNGKLRVNTNLFDDPFNLELKDGDILKIDTNAEFVPKE